ncbi:hypothetical protein TWF694_006961 [Orbilia ellipsospora]|uniref:Putative gamma-glutamylcyclotransferase n=1 Tax=Orbilia ellipsospora TaxID=2528407 RepID=A0AAV9XM44_9PEZI
MVVSKRIAEDYIDEAGWSSISTTTVQPPSPPPATSFEPTLFFFYGTLTIPQILKRVLGLSEDPVLIKAQTRSLKMKMWGPYPALADSNDDGDGLPVDGFAYEVKTEEHLRKLVEYEGANYKIGKVLIELSGNGREETGEGIYGMTFVWNSYAEELTDGGQFDSKLFQQMTLKTGEA